jgi:DNA repair exonuclease SbcCD ATPase subunit
MDQSPRAVHPCPVCGSSTPRRHDQDAHDQRERAMAQALASQLSTAARRQLADETELETAAAWGK